MWLQRVASLAAPVLLALAGIFVFMLGMLLVAGILLAPSIIPLAWFVLELGDAVSVELPGLF